MRIGRYMVRASSGLYATRERAALYERLSGGHVIRFRVGPLLLGYVAWWRAR